MALFNTLMEEEEIVDDPEGFVLCSRDGLEVIALLFGCVVCSLTVASSLDAFRSSDSEFDASEGLIHGPLSAQASNCSQDLCDLNLRVCLNPEDLTSLTTNMYSAD